MDLGTNFALEGSEIWGTRKTPPIARIKSAAFLRRCTVRQQPGADRSCAPARRPLFIKERRFTERLIFQQLSYFRSNDSRVSASKSASYTIRSVIVTNHLCPLIAPGKRAINERLARVAATQWAGEISLVVLEERCVTGNGQTTQHCPLPVYSRNRMDAGPPWFWDLVHFS